ncbi:RND transporter [Candidatus Tenderia electrophaga]|jgi:RND family efflux transporter MFP subunit|uniref:RND transporter n=1 Tax=Candidatus Tenderia electrophaga TaxID=1748243 RepID=A0A0S2T9G8_9GAMM|nr:RND transporter [Candidatus Tenderia electrophaga]
MPFKKLLPTTLLLVLVVGGLGWLAYPRLQAPDDGDAKPAGGDETRPVPVETALIEQRPIALRRGFTGSLEAHAEFTVSPKVDGRLVELEVDLGDAVRRDQVVARLDDAEYRQSVAQAEADLAVARANLAEARSQRVIAERELERLDQLSERGVSSASQRDVAKAAQLAREAHVQVTQAQVMRAESQLEAARIRLGYTQVRAAWRGGNDSRVVAERFLDEGETVSANAPLLRIVEFDPVTAVFFVTERDYARLQAQQAVALSTDAYPGETFSGRIARIAPVFRENTRQARVEVHVANPDLRLKPGMFARAQVILASVAEARVVPEQALTKRDGQTGVFVVGADGRRAHWRPVTVGISDAGRVQITGERLSGRVVTLGQQLLDDGSAITRSGAE